MSVISGPEFPSPIKDVTNVTSWSSSNESVATINQSGLTIGLSEGTTTITASYGGLTYSAVLEVSQPILPPIITLVSPENNSNASNYSTIVFQYNATGSNALANATAYIFDSRGLGLTDADRDSLTLVVLPNLTFPFNSTGGSFSGDAIQITSGKPDAFRFNAGNVSTVFVIVNWSNNQSVTGAINPGVIIFIPFGQAYYSAVNGSPVPVEYGTGELNNVTSTLQYYYSDNESSVINFTWGAVRLCCTYINGSPVSSVDYNMTNLTIKIPEFINEQGESVAAVGGNDAVHAIHLFYDVNNRRFATEKNSSVISLTPFGTSRGGGNGYTIANTSVGTKTARGSILDNYGTSSVAIRYAKKLEVIGPVVYSATNSSALNGSVSSIQASLGNLSNGSYAWGIQACDTASNCAN